jgi:NAD(P)-dependent dehydrogenase (short-subunit alcohol dehydrogenase family)
MSTHRRVVLVTGGANGIGLGIARRLAAEGWSLALNGRRAAREVAPAIGELRSAGVDVVYFEVDVAVPEQRRALVPATVEAFGRLDALVNNAGITSPGRKDFLEATEESFDVVIGTNLKAPYFLGQAAALQMIRQREAEPDFRGKIVNVSSINATVVSTNRGDYGMSKAGLASATQTMAVRLAPFGIDCYEIRPGLILTDMSAAAKAKYDVLIAEGLTLEPRWGDPDDIGRVAAAALRGDIPYSTGQVFVVDGGFTITRL